VEIVTQREMIQRAPHAFKSQYGLSRGEAAAWKPGWTRGQIIDALNALDTGICTVADIDATIGTKGWASNECDICDEQNAEIIMRLGDEPDHDARWQDICLPCISRLGAVAAQAIEARRAETGTGSVHESAVGNADAPESEPHD
jgi:hypothetical protein